jgi:hypothetical protein
MVEVKVKNRTKVGDSKVKNSRWDRRQKRERLSGVGNCLDCSTNYGGRPSIYLSSLDPCCLLAAQPCMGCRISGFADAC